MAQVINAVIKLRKDTEENYIKVENQFIPLNGEVCLVDTLLFGLRSKVGDGVHTFKELPYSDDVNSIVITGYYLNGKFYTDTTYLTQIPGKGKHIYVDSNSNGGVFIWRENQFEQILARASSEVQGIMKLYQTSGSNTDGTMSQKVITEGVQSIKLQLDSQDEECLILGLPWQEQD